jgi:hypothetical protein
MTIYCGVDFHARQQSISYCDASDGELHYQELDHEGDDVRAFYSRFTGEVVVGLEASGRERLVRAITGGARPSSLAWQRGREQLFSLPMTPAMSHQRESWLSLLADLNSRVTRVDEQPAVCISDGSFL